MAPVGKAEVVSIACGTITTICSVRLLIGFLIQHRKRVAGDVSYEPVQDDLYSDEDGTATAESTSRYKVRGQKLGIVVGSVAGFGLAVASAVVSLSSKHTLFQTVDSWLLALSWAWLAVASLCLLLEHAHARVYQHARWTVSLVTFLATAEALVTLWKTQNFNGSVYWALLGGKAAAVSGILVCALWLPRRPDVYFNGKLVDRMRTVGLLSRYTFHWAGLILLKAFANGHLDEADIAVVDRARRAEYLLEQFNELNAASKLWLRVFRAHWKAFVCQWIGTVALVTFSYLPVLILNRILNVLEARGTGTTEGYEGYYWVLLLALVKLLENGALSYVYWICFAYLMIPIRSQLSAIVFNKTMSKKDIKGSQKDDGQVESNGKSASNKQNDEDEDQDELKDLNQGTINLLAVDSERISTFSSYTNTFVEGIFGAIFGFGWIYIVLGWQSVLAAIAVIGITTPFNAIFSKRYAKAQDELMALRDKKMAVVSEALQGIRQIKFSALERRWEQKIRDVRNEELATVRKVFVCDVAIISAWIINPTFLAAAALSTHAIIHKSLSASVAFPALAVFGELEWTLSVVPEMVADGLNALVSIKRIAKYLDSASMETVIKESDVIAMRDATVAWAADDDEATKDRFCLRDLNIEFPRNELSVISGRTGSGKSLLLSSLLGEADLLAGSIEMPLAPCSTERSNTTAHPGNWILPSAVAYVAQIPWIENGTLRDNIIFGLPYLADRYQKVVHACALEKDLESLSDGEMTEIGGNGINLSGGQRWRVSFARAVYSRAGILILDDVFSAVDAHVGKHLFEHALTGDLMNNRTRILVTHHLRLCISRAKYGVFLADGVIENVGTISDLQNRGVLERIIAVVEDGAQEAEEQIREEELELTRSVTRDSIATHAIDGRKHSVVDVDAEPLQTPLQFVPDEERERGAVKMSIYSYYAKSSGGWLLWFICLFLFTFQEVLVLAKSYWVKEWTSSYDTSSNSTLHVHPSILGFTHHSLQKIVAAHTPSAQHDLYYWIGIYVLMNTIVCIAGPLRYWYVYLRSLRGSRILFDRLVSVILRAPLRWLDTVPTGRILNRFAKDFEAVDYKLANNLAYLMWNLLSLLGINVAAIYISPYIVAIASVALAANVYYAYVYLAGAREMKRLESNSRSPIFELFGAALSGVATVRAFGRSGEYTEKMFARIDTYAQRSFYMWLFNRWLSIRMALVGVTFILVVGILIIAIPTVDASMGGFALSFMLNYAGNVFWTLRRYANVELDMNSIERIVEYTNIETEDQGGNDAPAAWPTEGRIEVQDLHVSYAPELPPVLKGVNFTVKARERVGVVGRTGAGKSSLTLALFQFIRASQGTIYIDGLDISKLKLEHLRSRLAIIPQDPVLFSGTVRSNLDPFNEHSDTELQEALQRVHLIKPPGEGSGSVTPEDNQNKNMFNRMESKISEGGLNLSQGQRQLLCLARAIVSRPRILVLDEATSAVDMDTDALIQTSIREEFTDCTTLVIAHRLLTVIDYDRILVLGDGKVLEFDSPHELLEKKGAFYEMVQQTGESEMLSKMAKEAGTRS